MRNSTMLNEPSISTTHIPSEGGPLGYPVSREDMKRGGTEWIEGTDYPEDCWCMWGRFGTLNRRPVVRLLLQRQLEGRCDWNVVRCRGMGFRATDNEHGMAIWRQHLVFLLGGHGQRVQLDRPSAGEAEARGLLPRFHLKPRTDTNHIPPLCEPTPGGFYEARITSDLPHTNTTHTSNTHEQHTQPEHSPYQDMRPDSETEEDSDTDGSHAYMELIEDQDEDVLLDPDTFYDETPTEEHETNNTRERRLATSGQGDGLWGTPLHRHETHSNDHERLRGWRWARRGERGAWMPAETFTCPQGRRPW
ncbi:protein RL1 [Panine betaherpesvirus 2]|uniref:Protein RL1 n=1 Tax=Panine betaherpesvirus 2 TaxID=188763 RepID=Q8QS88_9BETA|nr:protein RL1 [Panine betaherpesvirus 2]AAM00649.1 protein RL1 [Panine betaherpesvirus 2]QXV67749.1 protein RL1 [Panine betaherpesvirus 2]